MMKLLEAIGLHYDIVVNKFDTIEENERAQFRTQIENEIKENGLKNMDKIFFVSAKFVAMFPDWRNMVDYLTKP